MSYRSDSEIERPRCISFDSLSREAQSALSATLYRGREVLLAEWDRMPWSHWGWAIFGFFGVIATISIAKYNFGNLLVTPRFTVLQAVVMGVGLSVALIGFWFFYSLRRLNQLPRGVFLLAFDLIDTRSNTLWIFPLSKARSILQRKGSVIIEFDGHISYTFHTAVPNFREHLQREQERIDRALSRGDTKVLIEVDPFLSQRECWPADSQVEAPPRFPWKMQVVYALLLGVVLGPVLALRTEQLSTQQGLLVAEREQDDETLLLYIRNGGNQAEKADGIRWDLAQRLKGEGGLLRYLRTGLNHQREAEIQIKQRIELAPSEQKIQNYLDAGGRDHAWADHQQLQLAIQAGDEATLRAYIRRGGRESSHVEHELLPRLMLQHSIEEKNLTLLALMKEDPTQLSAKQRETRGEFSEEIRREAQEQFEKIRAQEIRRYKESTPANHPFLKAIRSWIESQNPQNLPIKLSLKIVNDIKAVEKEELSYHLSNQSEVGEEIVSLIQEMFPPFLLQARFSQEEITPQDPLLFHFGYFLMKGNLHKTRGQLIFQNGPNQEEISVTSYCSPTLPSRAQILGQAMRDALWERKGGCQ